jgi:uncharacterized small protein (TIGR04563 family)
MDDKRKQSLYFPEDMMQDIKEEAIRQDRSLSWLMQRAWSIAREKIIQFPSADGSKPDERRKTGSTD